MLPETVQAALPAIAGEAVLWQVWAAGGRGPLGRRIFATEDGSQVEVVYPGRRTGGAGPDFRDALLCWAGGQMRQGDVEVHIHAADWQAHGHAGDDAFARLILHVVLINDAPPIERADGTVVPTLVLGRYLAADLVPLALASPLPIQPAPCQLDPDRAPSAVRGIVRAAGRQRLQAKADAFEGDLTCQTPDTVLFVALLDAAGYSRNRQPCRLLADRLPIAPVQSLCRSIPPTLRRRWMEAMLLGMAGLLPADDEALASLWHSQRALWPDPPLPASAWVRAAVRPANRPEQRLRGVAALVAAHAATGLSAGLLAPLRDTPVLARPSAVCQGLLAALRPPPSPTLIGAARAAEMVLNVLLPLALAWSMAVDDEQLAAAVWAVAAHVPAGSSYDAHEAMLARLTSAGYPLPRLTGLEQQGLLFLWRQHCGAHNCAECPLAETPLDEQMRVQP